MALAVLVTINLILIYLECHRQGFFYEGHGEKKADPSEHGQQRERPHNNLHVNLLLVRSTKNITRSAAEQPVMNYLLDNVPAEVAQTESEPRDYTSLYYHSIERCASTTVKTLLLKEAINSNLSVYKTGTETVTREAIC